MTMEERMEKGFLWTDTGEYIEEQTRAKALMYEFNMLHPSKREKRIELLHEIFASVGENVWMEPPLTVARGKTVTIGNNCYFNANLILVDDYKITIGNGVLVAPNVTIATTGHPVHPALRPNGEMYSFPVVIEDNVWIGCNVAIMPGVTIGENSVVGAGSVVTKDVPPNVVAVGNPCRVLRPITDRDLEYYYKNRKVNP